MPNRDQPEDALRTLLREWTETPAADAGLAERVTRAIAAKRRLPAWQAVKALFNPGDDWRRVAAAGVLSGILLGVGGVEWHAVRTRERLAREMPERYLRWIDPVTFAPAEVRR